MIDDLDRTLEELLRRELPAALVDQVSFSFAPPNDEFPPTSVTLPAIDVFLYDVRENRELRSNEGQLERRPNGTGAISRPPVRIDCSYLITAWPSENSTSPALDEHRLLGELIRALLRRPALPPEVLQGSLADQPFPVTLRTLQAGQLQNLMEFWQALGGRPKAALNLTVTLALQAHPAVETGPLVTERIFRIEVETPPS